MKTSREEVEYVIEKWLTAFKKYGHTLEVFENPSKMEMRGWEDKFRFIADSQRQKVYMWPATGAIHADAWVQIKKQLSDTRPLYKSSTLVAGVVENGWVYIYNGKGIPSSIAKQWDNEDWDFTKKYIPYDKLRGEMRKIQ